ncbi:MAG: hypothetical protein ACTHKT_06460 [Solirubrobacterales bacterium]
MGTGSTVEAPDGAQWRVQRRWLNGPLPNLRRSFRANRSEASEVGVLDGILNAPDLTDSGASIALGIAIFFVIFVLLPLLGVALELIFLLFLVFSGVVARVVFRRPWIVLAEKLGDPEEQVAFAVKGWRDSSTALRELRTALAATGPPERLTVGKPLATKRPSAAN